MKKELFRVVQVLIVISILLGTCACANRKSELSNDSGSTFNTPSVSESEVTQTEEVTTTTETTLPTKNPNPSEYSDYLDIPMPCENQIDIHTMTYNGKLINLFSENQVYLLFEFGFDNPILVNNLRDVIGDDTIDCQSVNYFQNMRDYIKQFGASFDTYFAPDFVANTADFQKLQLDIARYILEENGLRMWVDEIPYEFFEQKVNYLYNDNITLSDEELCNHMLYSVEYTPDGNDFTGFSSIKCNPGTDEYMKTISEFFFDAAAFYNSVRLSIIYDLGANQIRNTDGHNVIQFADEKIYNKVRETFKDFYGYDFDPIHNGPETREDLAINYFNIPVEEFDEAAKAIGGVKFERTNPYDQNYDQSNQ